MILNLKKIREKQNLKQKDLARLVGVGASTVCMWESGSAIPRAQKLFKLAEVLNCRVDELMKEGGNEWIKER